MRFWPLPRKTAPRAVYSRSKKSARQQVDSDYAMTGKLVREGRAPHPDGTEVDPAAWDAWCRRPAEEVADEWLTTRRAELLPAYVDHLTTAAPKMAHCLRLLRATPCVGPKMRANVQKLLDETPRRGHGRRPAAARR